MTEGQGTLHHNNLGALRLLLAYAVIVSHSPEMLDGNPIREPLIALGSHITLGGLAVDGFFIISGYLIAASYLSTRSVRLFLRSRILRIFPAFLIAFLICIFLVGPIAGGDLKALGVRGGLMDIVRALLLEEPRLPGAFHSLKIPSLDGSMWTIRYEFRCYLFVALLGAIGFLDKRKLMLCMTVGIYALDTAISAVGISISPGLMHQLLFGVIGDPSILLGLLAIFLSGVCAFLYREWIAFHGPALIICLAVFALAIFRTPFLELAIGTVGCYLLLWVGMGLKSSFLEHLNNRDDFSYGVYLYAWPIAALIILTTQRFHLGISSTALTGLTIVLSTVMGAISWYAIERSALRLKREQPRRILKVSAQSVVTLH